MIGIVVRIPIWKAFKTLETNYGTKPSVIHMSKNLLYSIAGWYTEVHNRPGN